MLHSEINRLSNEEVVRHLMDKIKRMLDVGLYENRKLCVIEVQNVKIGVTQRTITIFTCNEKW